ncbi:hypothetical protein DL240_12635 [Lujinxingia litoralis]|uniref:Transglutaminase-like domain-containing protein n=2 Tax=Lujinxingia litoralis TaxID=2211119 RepID=A0A328C3T2_9DELT|nr:hypothetical protein DL240_12635 [Lujinxingia litoralis]
MPPGERVLHRYLDAEQLRALSEEGAGVAGGSSGPTRGALASPWSAGSQPSLSVEPGRQEWVWTDQGPVGPEGVEYPHGGLDPRVGSAELDANTDRVNALDYQASFEPSVVPWKRGVVHDAVLRTDAGDYRTRLGGAQRRKVAIGGGLGANEDRFWGSFLVRMERGRVHPVPSVAPEQRVLQVLSEPPVPVEVLRDGAGNFYVSAAYDGVVRVNMELGVDRFYFDGVLDPQIGWEQFDSPELRLPDQQARQVAGRVLGARGITRQMTPRQALDALVGYYRDFEGKPFPEDAVQGDRYEAITTLQVGVCRHRALAFLVSAGALGFESRFVYNEAHAFAEVRWPGQGWRRIDLGGAADGFNYQNMGSNNVHEGGSRDGFPQPQRYLDEIVAFDPGTSSASALGDGGPMPMEPERAAPRDVSMPSGRGGEMPEPPRGAGQDPLTTSPLREGSEELETRTEPVITITDATGEVFRGQPLAVRGRVVAGEVGRVEVLLVPVGARAFERAVSLGQAEVSAEGGFDGEWIVPPQVGLGRWELKARSAPGQPRGAR